MNISFKTTGIKKFEIRSAICFEINGVDIWFTVIERGYDGETPYDIIFKPWKDLPFDLTEEMEYEMYDALQSDYLAEININRKKINE